MICRERDFAVQDNKTTPKKRRRVTVLRVIMVLLLVAGCAFAIFRLSLRLKLNARIEAIRAAGYPVTFAELDEWYAMPDGAENAADAILDALSYCQEWEHQSLEPLPLVGHAELPARTEPLASETMSLMSEYLDDNRQALDMLHKAVADIEHCRYPVDFSAGINMEMSYLSDLRRGARLLQLEAILHAEKVKPQLAVRSVMSTLDLGRSLAREPMIGSYYNQRACQQFAVLSLERIINRTELTDEQLARLGEALADAEDRTDLLPALVGERCVGLAMFKMSTAQLKALSFFDNGRRNESPLSVHLRVVTFALRKQAGLVDKNTIIYLDMANDCVAALGLPLERRHEVVDAIATRLRSTSQHSILLHTFGRSLPRITVDFDTLAHVRTARVALAVQRYRLAVGKLPDTLADLVPAYLDGVPRDPFDGNDLRYRKLEPGFVVYSIGQDLSDDGGQEKLPQKTRKGRRLNWDVTFTVER
ncbi:MAG: hypothetical protein CEE38_19105 [Planctomycetes bacterium B3_Pla]|nr:MAG: hypothetical protein CEE38_19105 [Planctomycetes bacterium B3_Pla]